MSSCLLGCPCFWQKGLTCVCDVASLLLFFSSNLRFLSKEPFSTLPQSSCQKRSVSAIDLKPQAKDIHPWPRGMTKRTKWDGYNNKGKPAGSGTTQKPEEAG